MHYGASMLVEMLKIIKFWLKDQIFQGNSAGWIFFQSFLYMGSIQLYARFQKMYSHKVDTAACRVYCPLKLVQKEKKTVIASVLLKKPF